MRTTNQIDDDICELKKKMQQDKLIDLHARELLKKQQCDSSSSLIKCDKCNCWKVNKDDLGDVLESEKED